jgi:hypothetical protein
MQRKTTDEHRSTQRGLRRSHRVWSAAGSAAPRRFRKQGRARKAVSPLRSATALQSSAVRARSCMIVVQRGLRRSHRVWSAAGSEAPRRFRKQGHARKAVSPLRSATAVQIFAVRARSCRIVVQIRTSQNRAFPWRKSVHPDNDPTRGEARPASSPWSLCSSGSLLLGHG